MKRVMAMLLALSVLLALAGCGTKETAAPEDDQYPSCFLPESKERMGATEEEIVSLHGDGERLTMSGEVSVMRYYDRTDTYRTETTPVQISYKEAFGFDSSDELVALMYFYDIGSMTGMETRQLVDDIEAMLTAQYGTPSVRGEKWYDGADPEDLDSFRDAVLNDGYDRIVIWEMDDMAVVFDAASSYLCYTNSAADISAAKMNAEILNTVP